jgi:glutamate-5-semialdehyde dehydrogenase
MTNDAILAKLENLKAASRKLRSAKPEQKKATLEKAAKLLLERSTEILKANSEDLKSLPGDTTPAFRDRLLLNESRLAQMAESLKQVSALPDPVGELVDSKVLQNGLKIRRVRSPLGVILMIFESRPNVATEAFSLAFKSGNVILLRGGRESMRTTAVLYQLLTDAVVSNQLPVDCLWGITDADRKLTEFLLKQKKWIDIVVPRGGDGLIEYVTLNSRIPIIKNDRGLCHVYVHEDGDPEMAVNVVVNAKTQRPGVCNSMETLLVHETPAATLLPKVYQAMESLGVQWRGCEKTLSILKGRANVSAVTESSFDTEYLDLILNCKVVAGFDEAVSHIENHGSRHSEAILTRSADLAKRFENEVDAAAVYWNASTRFTDGFELGLGGELGISTQKLHVRGPVGLKELTSVRWIIEGEGQVRA